MRDRTKLWRQKVIKSALCSALAVFTFSQCDRATPAPQATIDTISVNVDAKNAERFLDFWFKHEDKIVGLKVTLWYYLEESVFHVELKGENLSTYVTGGKVELFCLSCARYYQGADGYFLVKTEFHNGSFDVFLRKLDEAQVLLSHPRKRSVELRG